MTLIEKAKQLAEKYNIDIDIAENIVKKQELEERIKQLEERIKQLEEDVRILENLKNNVL